MRLGLVARSGLWRFILRTTVLGVGCGAAFTASAQALAHPILVETHNRTAHTIIVGPTDGANRDYLGPGGSWNNITFEKTRVTVNMYRFKPSGSGVIECGELEFVNPVFGFPEVKLFKVAERPKQGFAETIAFAVNKQHTFHYGDAKLHVKRLSDKVHGVLFPPVFKSFDLSIDHC
jgi:hypothetical protein